MELEWAWWSGCAVRAGITDNRSWLGCGSPWSCWKSGTRGPGQCSCLEKSRALCAVSLFTYYLQIRGYRIYHGIVRSGRMEQSSQSGQSVTRVLL